MSALRQPVGAVRQGMRERCCSLRNGRAGVDVPARFNQPVGEIGIVDERNPRSDAIGYDKAASLTCAMVGLNVWV
jgi:hypothetical protein